MWQELLALWLSTDWSEHMELTDNIFRKFAIHNMATFHNLEKSLHLGFTKIILVSLEVNCLGIFKKNDGFVKTTQDQTEFQQR